MKDKLSNRATIVLALFVILGLAIAIHTIISAIQAFNLPVLLIQILEMSGLIWAYYYVFGDETKSKPFFLSMFSTLAIVLLLVYSLFPNSSFPEAIRRTTVVISIVGVAAIVYLLSNWKKYRICIPVSYVVSTSFFILAIIDSFYTGGDYMLLSDIWVRPVLATLIVGCYIGRMHQKFRRRRKSLESN